MSIVFSSGDIALIVGRARPMAACAIGCEEPVDRLDNVGKADGDA